MVNDELSANGQRSTANDFDHCYTAALRILNYRFNSEAELREQPEFIPERPRRDESAVSCGA